MIRRRFTNLKEFWERRNREAAAIDAAAALFINAAEGGQLPAENIAANAAIFPLWIENTPHSKGCLRRCPICGDVFRCIDPPPVSPQARNSRIPPSEAHRFWERVAAECADPCADPLEAPEGSDE